MKRIYEEDIATNNVEPYSSQPSTPQSHASSVKSSVRTNLKKRTAPSNIHDSLPEILKEYVQDKKLARLQRKSEASTSEDKNIPLVEFFVNMGKTAATFPPMWQATVKSKVFEIVNSIELQLLAETSAPITVPVQGETFVQKIPSSFSSNSTQFQLTSFSQQLPNKPLLASRYYSTFGSQLPPQPHSNRDAQHIQTIQTGNREPPLASGYYSTFGSQLSPQLRSNENVQHTQIVSNENREPSLASGYYSTFEPQLPPKPLSNENVQHAETVITENREPSCLGGNSVGN